MSHLKKYLSLIILMTFSQPILAETTETSQISPSEIKTITQSLVPPPLVPEHDQLDPGPSKLVKVKLVIEEKLMDIDDNGTKIWAMTYNGTVPGPLIVAHQDDYVELTLVNPKDNTLPHNIDFHAATGAMGGGDLTMVGPGQEVVLRFKATKPGVFVYHCAPGGLMVPWHVVSGMSGAIMVLPRDGLKDANGTPVKYDKAYYIGEQDFYIPTDDQGQYKTYSSPLDGFNEMLTAMKKLIPTHIVFNGKVGALTGDNALTAQVGERVLIIHAQANRDTRPHLIGGHADFVWQGGSFSDRPATNLETWFVPGGSATAMLYQFKQPGLHAYLNHNLIEAFQFGAVAHINVSGDWDDDLMMQIQKPGPITE